GVVKKCSMDSARLVGPDIAKERHHAAHWRAVEFERWMEPDHLAGDVIGEREAARGDIAGDHRATRIARFVPEPQREGRTVIGGAFGRYGAGPRPPRRRLPAPSLPRAKAKRSSHIVPTFQRRVAGERMHDEAIRGRRLNLDRERAVGAAVAGTWRHDVAARYAATERARHPTRIERHRAASPCAPLRPRLLLSMAGSRSTQSRRSDGSTSVRRPRLTARKAPDLIAS